MSIRLRRGTDAQRLSVIFLDGELVYTTDTNHLFVGDGTTAGGIDIINLIGSAHTHDDRYYTETEIDVIIDALTDENVKVSAGDTTPGFLVDKIISGDGIDGSILGVGANEQLKLDAQIYIDTINGFDHPVYKDTSRGNRILSTSTSLITWSETAVSNNEWMHIGRAVNADTGHVIPYDATLVGITLNCENDSGNTKGFRIYVNNLEVDTNAISTSGIGENNVVNNNLNIDIISGDKIKLRATGSSGQILDTVVSIYVKWRKI